MLLVARSSSETATKVLKVTIAYIFGSHLAAILSLFCAEMADNGKLATN